jgi:hypothetical protein
MPNPTHNPIPFTGLFHTPADSTELFSWVAELNGSERNAAMRAACMALNLAHTQVAHLFPKEAGNKVATAARK